MRLYVLYFYSMLGLYYPSPIMGAIIGGTLINSLGAFVPFDKGNCVLVLSSVMLVLFLGEVAFRMLRRVFALKCCSHR